MPTSPITNDWRSILETEFPKPYMQQLKRFLLHQKQSGHTIFPPNAEVFAAFNATSFSVTKVVLLGQDPYHGDGQGHGLAFSVRPGVAIPPSLQNIYRELENDLGVSMPSSGHLYGWAKQGVLLLNSVLTVNKNQPASHRNQGWEQFTDTVISYLNQHKVALVYMLWGSYARSKKLLIDDTRHLVLTATHPSPLSANRGFFGSRPFSKANHYLREHKLDPIEWTHIS